MGNGIKCVERVENQVKVGIRGKKGSWEKEKDLWEGGNHGEEMGKKGN